MSIKKELLKKEDGTLVEKTTIESVVDPSQRFKEMAEDIQELRKESDRVLESGAEILSSLGIEEDPKLVFEALYNANSKEEIDAIFLQLKDKMDV